MCKLRAYTAFIPSSRLKISPPPGPPSCRIIRPSTSCRLGKKEKKTPSIFIRALRWLDEKESENNFICSSWSKEVTLFSLCKKRYKGLWRFAYFQCVTHHKDELSFSGNNQKGETETYSIQILFFFFALLCAWVDSGGEQGRIQWIWNTGQARTWCIKKDNLEIFIGLRRTTAVMV